jgi:NADH:ubiquinone reductase (H+-translocating)
MDGTMTSVPKVIIVGGGFAGIAAARALGGVDADVLLIDRRNHHLFQPLLYQVATAALAPAEIAQPIRHMLRSHRNVRVHWDEVTGVDRTARNVHTSSGRTLGFDYLVIATGATQSYFGRDEWAEHAPGLKSVEDAYNLRHRILGAFERAEMEVRGPKRDALLEFVIVGAGPTGVEMAGAIAELARHSLARDFRSVSSTCAKIKLVEAGPRILPTFHATLSDKAQKALEAIGVEVLTSTRVTDIQAGTVRLDEKPLATETVIWAAGVKASPAAEWLSSPADRTGRAIVDGHLRLANDDRIFVIGDTAAFIPTGATQPLPGLAPMAKQMGKHVGAVIKAQVLGKTLPKPFRYRDWGTMATIGRNKAIADFGAVKLSGFFAWIAWSLAHVSFLYGFTNRISVGSSWIWAYLTWQRGARVMLIPVRGNTLDKET